MRRIIHYTEAAARDFFERLSSYSDEYVRVALSNVYKKWPSANHYEEWFYDNHPIGHALHYTAGINFAGTIRHFVMQFRASTNWVIAKALDERFKQLRKDLDLDNDLRSECLQIIPPTKPAWHAGWANKFLSSSEIRNAGILRPCLKGKKPHTDEITRDYLFSFDKYEVEDLDFYWWPNNWTTKVPKNMEVIRVKSNNGVSYWESFSRGSIATLITVLRYLNSLYPDKLDPLWMLCHHNVNPSKNDIVLPIPLHEIRNSVLFSKTHVDDLDWLSELDDFEDKFEDDDNQWLLSELNDKQSDRAEEDLDGFDPNKKIVGKVNTKEETTEGLYRLGYFTGYPETDPEVVKRSIRIFQRSRNLVVDGIASPSGPTNQKLTKELKSWRIK